MNVLHGNAGNNILAAMPGPAPCSAERATTSTPSTMPAILATENADGRNDSVFSTAPSPRLAANVETLVLQGHCPPAGPATAW